MHRTFFLLPFGLTPVSLTPVSLTLASLTLVAAMAGTASAQSCIDRVRELGARHGIVTDPPTFSLDRSAPGSESGVSTRQLGRSGGVVEPPRVQDKAVIAPPPAAGAAMPTLPDVTPAPPSNPRGAETARAVDRTTLQALLMAARAQAERGNEQGCLDGLAKAQQLDHQG